MAILISEQKVKMVLNLANRGYVLRVVKIVLERNTAEMVAKGEYKKKSS